MVKLQLIHGAGEGVLEDLARELHRALRHQPVVLLHDRRLEDGSITDHLAIGPGGVTVIGAARDFRAPLRVEAVPGAAGARAEGLFDGVGDRTARVELLREQVFVLRRLLEDRISIRAALCPQAPGVALVDPLVVGGVVVGGPVAAAALACRDNASAELDVPALVDRLDRTLEPVFGREH